MAEDTGSTQGGNLNETIQQIQQGTVQQQQESLIERKGYGPLVDPAPDAFPLHYRSPYVPGSGTNDAAVATPAPAPVVNPGQSNVSATSTTASTTQQGEGSK